MRRHKLIAVIASLAVFFNATGAAMASPPADAQAMKADAPAAHCADMLADDSKQPASHTGGCCADGMCACVVHGVATIAMHPPVLFTPADGPAPVSTSRAVPAPFDDPLRPPIA